MFGEAINSICAKWQKEYTIPSFDRDINAQQKIPFHITVISSYEYDLLSTEQTVQLDYLLHDQASGDISIDIFDAGICHIQKGCNEMWLIAIYSSWIDNIRNILHLPSKDLHITLVFQQSNLHNISKGFETITKWNESLKEIILLLERIATLNLCDGRAKFLVRHFFQLGDIRNEVGLVKLIGQWALRAEDVTLAKELGYCLFETGIFFGFRLLCFSENSEILMEYLKGKLPVTLENKLGEKQFDLLKSFNIGSFQLPSIDSVHKHLWKHCSTIAVQRTKGTDILCFNHLPRNFSWITLPVTENLPNRSASNLLAGSAIPTSKEHIAALRCVGIRSIFTLHESPLPPDLITSAAVYGIQTHHYCIADRHPPTREQTLDICRQISDEINEGRGVLVHCQGGLGRTNFAIIAFLVTTFTLTCIDATRIVTNSRKVLMADCQINSLKSWWAYTVNQKFDGDLNPSMQQRKTPDVISAPSSSIGNYRDIARTLRLPPIILLCGFAASGKSTFSTALVSAHPEYFRRINKDEMRGKGQIDSALNNAMQNILSGGHYSGSVVIDCCNLTQSKRKEWLAACHNSDAWCIFFDVSLEDCKERIRYRDNHPTIPAGSAGITILDSMSKQLQPPQHGESFSRIINLRCEDEVAELLHEWMIPFVAPESFHMKEQHLLKFPRTPHLLNLGAATRDDKILSSSDIAQLLSASQVGRYLFIEEKLDGANMGISIDPSTSRIQVQNRSHYVSASYHPQFAPLNRWIDKHSMELWDILEPGRHILYGEWLYATHSVRYTALPDWFIAYDCYDRVAAQFLCRKALEALLARTTIAIAPIIHEGPVPNLEFILSLADAGSAFNQERREGIVIRVCDEEKVISRAKLVRKDFIAGNERWDRSCRFALSTNELAIQKEMDITHSKK